MQQGVKKKEEEEELQDCERAEPHFHDSKDWMLQERQDQHRRTLLLKLRDGAA